MSDQRLPAAAWKEDVPAPRLKDALAMVAEFLQKLKYKESHKALVAEANKKGVEITKKDFTGDNFAPLSSLFVASYKQSGSKGYTWEGPAQAEDRSDSDSEDSDSDSSEASDEQPKKIVVDSKGGPIKRKRDETSVSEASDDDSSEASDSDDSSAKEEARPAKRAKTQAAPVEVDTSSASSDSESESDSDDDSASTSSDSEDDSSSDSSASDSESDSESTSTPPPPKSKKAATKAKAKITSGDSSASTSSSATLTNSTPPPKSQNKTKIPEEAVSNGDIHPSRLSRVPKAQATPQNETAVVHSNGKDKKTVTPFSRIAGWDEKVDPRFSSNEYVSYDYADRAYQDLVVTKGKGFTKEKNKKKRGAYRGGAIDLTPKGIKFDD